MQYDINSITKSPLTTSRNPLAQMEEERKEYESKIEVMKNEMEVVFEAKVNEKVRRLAESEAEVSAALSSSNFPL